MKGATHSYGWYKLRGQDSSVGKEPELAIYRSQVWASRLADCFFWYEPVASPSLQIANVASKHHGKNNGGPNQWIIRAKIISLLLKIHLSFSH